MPDVTDLLSTVDWMIREQSSFGPGLDADDATERSSPGELARVRDLVVQALCYSLGTYAALDRRDEICARYRGILPQAELDPGDFGQFVRRAAGRTLGCRTRPGPPARRIAMRAIAVYTPAVTRRPPLHSETSRI